MPSLYDNVQARNSRYIPQAIGSNFAELDKAAAKLEERYYRNQELTDKIAIAAAQDQYLQQDQGIRDEITQRIRDDIDHITSSPENFENSTGAVSKIVRDYATNQKRLAATRNFQEAEKYKELRTKLQAEGKLLDFNPLENFQGTVNPDGTFNQFQGDVQRQLDYDARKEQFFNQIAPDKNNKEWTKLQDVMRGFVGKNIFTGITNQKIKNYLDPAFTRYKQTDEYRQERRKLTELEGVPEEDVDDVIKASLLAVGQERVFGQTDQQIHNDPAELLRMKKEFEDGAVDRRGYEQPPGINYTPLTMDLSKLQRKGLSFGQTLDPIVQRYKEFRKNEKTGNYVIAGRVVGKVGDPNLDASYDKLQKEYTDYLNTNKVGEFDTLEGEDKKIYDNVIESLAREQKLDISKDEVKYGEVGRGLVADYFRSLEGQEFVDTPVYKDYTRLGEEGRSSQKDATQDLQNNFLNRAFVDRDNPNEVITGADLMEELGYSRKEFDKFQNVMQVVGEYDPQNMFPSLVGGKDSPNNAFVAPLAVNIAGKQYLASRRQSEIKGGNQAQREVVNKLYTAAKQLPGIQNRVRLQIGGNTKDYYVQELPERGVYIVEPADRSVPPLVYRDLNGVFRDEGITLEEAGIEIN